jgi:hypothetical protein
VVLAGKQQSAGKAWAAAQMLAPWVARELPRQMGIPMTIMARLVKTSASADLVRAAVITAGSPRIDLSQSILLTDLLTATLDELGRAGPRSLANWVRVTRWTTPDKLNPPRDA